MHRCSMLFVCAASVVSSTQAYTCNPLYPFSRPVGSSLRLSSAEPAPLHVTRRALTWAAAATAALPAASATALPATQNPIDVSGVRLPESLRRRACQNAVLIFHGRGGPDRETDDLKLRFLSQDESAGLSRVVEVFDWRPWLPQDVSQLSFASTDVGRVLGTALAEAQPGLRSLHIVGTSAGGFAANACCSAYATAARGGGRAIVRLSLTDPFTAEAGAGAKGRGADQFGRDADFAEHFLNTDDIVPNTATPLPLCYCYDVTTAAERRTFPPPDKSGDFVSDLILRSLGYHNWPMGYLARHYETTLDGEGRVVHPSHEDMPRGTVEKVA